MTSSGKRVQPERPDRASIWTDTNIYNEVGIPAIKIGPRDRRISSRNKEINIDVMHKAAPDGARHLQPRAASNAVNVGYANGTD
jgi:hypothetical protein